MQQNIEELVRGLVLTDDLHLKEAKLRELWGIAKENGVYAASIQELYAARGRGECSGFTVPAINIRMLTFDLARAIFRSAMKIDAGAVILEIARSEMGYTDQRPAEYAGVCLAAAVAEGYKGPVFIQGDHFQVNAKKYKDAPEKEIKELKRIIKDAVSSGFYNIDIDSSTLVDLSKTDMFEEQKLNFEVCAELTKFIRNIQPDEVMVSVGGEIGEVGKQNSTPEELAAFMKGYCESVKENGISKISVQTGTSHGGVVLPDGKIAEVKLDFETLKVLSELARKEYGMSGAVQHGASTLPEEAFDKFPEMETAEVHLATQFQNMVYEAPSFPTELKERIYEWLKVNCANERKEGQTEDQFIYKTRKKALGPFKKEIMGLPKEVREEIAASIEQKFDILFDKLNIKGTRALVEKFVKQKPVEFSREVEEHIAMSSEGDD